MEKKSLDDPIAEIMGQIILRLAPFIQSGKLTHFNIDFAIGSDTYTLALIQTKELLNPQSKTK